MSQQVDLWLENCQVSGTLSRDNPLVKLLIDEFRWDLMDCAARLTKLPSPLARGIPMTRAKELEARFTALGATVSIRPADVGTAQPASATTFDAARFRQLAAQAGWNAQRTDTASSGIRRSLDNPMPRQECLEAWDAIGGASQRLVIQCYRQSNDFTEFAVQIISQSPCPATYLYPLYRIAQEKHA
jgi:hypothetical protein